MRLNAILGPGTYELVLGTVSTRTEQGTNDTQFCARFCVRDGETRLLLFELRSYDYSLLLAQLSSVFKTWSDYARDAEGPST